MDTSIKRLLEVAGVDITQGKAKQLVEGQTGRFEKLLSYYTDGFEGFGNSSDDKKAKRYVAGINGGDIKKGTPEYKTAVDYILNYGSSVTDKELKSY